MHKFVLLLGQCFKIKVLPSSGISSRKLCRFIRILEILVEEKNNKISQVLTNITQILITFQLQNNKKRITQLIHGVIEVIDLTWRLSRRRIVGAGIVNVAHHTLEPGQNAS